MFKIIFMGLTIAELSFLRQGCAILCPYYKSMPDVILQHQPRRPWWKRTWGVLLIVVGGGLAVIALAFAVFVFSRVRAIQRGEVKSLTSFNNEFTKGAITTSTSTTGVALVRETNIERGDPTGKVMVVMFGDFQCPFTRKEFPVIRQMMETMTGVRFVYRDFPVLEIHPQALQSAVAARCANEQKKFWEYHDQLFLNQEDLSDEALARYATAVGLDTTQFATCLKSQKYRKDVLKDMQDGAALGVQGTPTFFVNGVKVEGAVPFDAWGKIFKWFPV